ncbi:MAG: hypothetical protein RLN78_00055 [Phycisphaerales bacterium]
MLYSLGIAIMLGKLLNDPITPRALIYVALCAHSGYLMDRIKFRDADLDPADLMAEPLRHAYLRNHARFLRIVMWIEWVLAIGVGFLITPLLGAFVLSGIAAGYLYSGWKPGKVARLKDVAGLKAVMVSCAVLGLCVAAVLGERILEEGPHVWPEAMVIVCTLAGMGLVVFGDAVICDLDDRVSDGRFNTKSLPVMVGSRIAAFVGGGILLLGGMVIVAGGINHDDLQLRAVFAAMVAISGLGILRWGSAWGGRRDWIDGRMMVASLLMIVALGS